jgi:hypothetical protein
MLNAHASNVPTPHDRRSCRPQDKFTPAGPGCTFAGARASTNQEGGPGGDPERLG